MEYFLGQKETIDNINRMNENYAKHDKKVNKETIKRYIGSILLIGALGSGISICHGQHSKVDHTQEYCFLNNIFGVGHQIDYINDEIYFDPYTLTWYNPSADKAYIYEMDPYVKLTENGEQIYVAPNGYILGNDGKNLKCYKMSDQPAYGGINCYEATHALVINDREGKRIIRDSRPQKRFLHKK